ncbi:unnamed protein product [Rotaria sp. Silwood2]|nr:unnamed protein product [Rotaria sp. Silwood2]CAF2957267.1 unnamed protein product [Rotaria sp. Silwood2]CAF3147499.1 unnamed protein product [Rotaria sp. Silwood2]CAF3961978.1 unnamed protein product [Rotaria sp. Silwood2]CAF4413500.1 unnamed protein product [Rotaria sp. Silwood2]
MFVNNRINVYVRRYRHDPRRFERSQPRTHKGGGLGVWSCLSNYGLGDLIFYDGRLNSSEYINILDTHLKSAYSLFPKRYRDKKMFQQDNARHHVSRKTQEYIKKPHITILEWQASSTDLNLIENIWSIVDKKLLKYLLKNVDDLKAAMNTIWNDILIDTIQKLYKSINNRLKEVIKRKGLSCNS